MPEAALIRVQADAKAAADDQRRPGRRGRRRSSASNSSSPATSTASPARASRPSPPRRAKRSRPGTPNSRARDERGGSRRPSPRPGTRRPPSSPPNARSASAPTASGPERLAAADPAHRGGRSSTPRPGRSPEDIAARRTHRGHASAEGRLARAGRRRHAHRHPRPALPHRHRRRLLGDPRPAGMRLMTLVRDKQEVRIMFEVKNFAHDDAARPTCASSERDFTRPRGDRRRHARLAQRRQHRAQGGLLLQRSWRTAKCPSSTSPTSSPGSAAARRRSSRSSLPR